MSRACSLAGCPLQERVQLDAILTVVDAKHVLQHLDDKFLDSMNMNGGPMMDSMSTSRLVRLYQDQILFITRQQPCREHGQNNIKKGF